MLESQEVSFDVYLMNGYCISISVYTTDCSSKILEAACLAVDIPKEMIYYFGLFVMRTEENGGVVLTRRLDDFEAPYITKQYMEDCKIVIRKNYWDPCYDGELTANRISMNLLYIQTVSDVERSWILTTANDREILSSLQARGNKKNVCFFILLFLLEIVVCIKKIYSSILVFGNCQKSSPLWLSVLQPCDR